MPDRRLGHAHSAWCQAGRCDSLTKRRNCVACTLGYVGIGAFGRTLPGPYEFPGRCGSRSHLANVASIWASSSPWCWRMRRRFCVTRPGSRL